MFKACLVALLALLVLSGCYPQKQKSLIERPESFSDFSAAHPEERSDEGSHNVLQPFGLQGDPYVKDFGLVKAGEVVRHSFIIKNESKRVLNIKGVTTSCGCTASEVRDKILKPGESTNLDVKFNSKGYSGAVQQFVYVDTDNLDNPVIRYIIKADVIK